MALAGIVSIGRYAARLEAEERESVVESAFFVALGAQGFGTISGENPPSLAYAHINTCILGFPSVFFL